MRCRGIDLSDVFKVDFEVCDLWTITVSSQRKLRDWLCSRGYSGRSGNVVQQKLGDLGWQRRLQSEKRLDENQDHSWVGCRVLYRNQCTSTLRGGGQRRVGNF